MKKSKLFFVAAIMFAVMSLGATNPTESASEKAEGNKQLITGEQIIAYLQGAPHFHWACCARPVPGSSNWTATIENCGSALVYVSNGIIVGHSDANGYCGD